MDAAQQQMLESLATKLGTTADYLWKVQVSWMHTQAVTDCVIVAIASPLCFIACYIVYRMARFAYDDGADGLGMIAAMAAMALLVLIGPLILLVNEALLYSLNPEGAALHQIIKALAK